MAARICQDVVPQRADDLVPAGEVGLDRSLIVGADLCHELPQLKFARRQGDERQKCCPPETSAAEIRSQRETAISVAIPVVNLGDLRVTKTFPRRRIRHDPEGATRFRTPTCDPGADRSIVEMIREGQKQRLKLGITPQRCEKAEIIVLRTAKADRRFQSDARAHIRPRHTEGGRRG